MAAMTVIMIDDVYQYISLDMLITNWIGLDMGV